MQYPENKIGTEANEAAVVTQAQAVIDNARQPRQWLDDVELAAIGNSIAGEQLRWQRYVQIGEGAEKWKAMDSASVAGYLADAEPMFATMMLTTATEEQPEDAFYITDRIFFDIDRENIEDAIESTSELVGNLVSKGLPLEAIGVWASGSKGCHVAIPLVAFLQDGAAGLRTEDLKALPTIFKEIVGDVALFVDGLDLSIYSAKRGRMLRRANVQRKNGAYKVVIPAGELATLTPARYAELVSAPRSAVAVSPAPYCPDLAAIWTAARDRALNTKRKQAGRKTLPQVAMTPEHVSRLENALYAIDPNIGYLDWVRVGMGIHHAMGDAGLTVWDRWSQGGSNYKPGECAAKWAGFFAGMAGGATDATIYMLARQAGWLDPAPHLNPARDVTVNPDALPPRYDPATFAEFLAIKYQASVRYAGDAGSWLHYEGRKWEFTDETPVWSIIKAERKRMLMLAAQEEDEAKSSGLVKFASKLTQSGFVKGVIEFLSREEGLRVSATELDADDHVINLENCALDLRTGERLPHSPDLLLAHMAHVSYDPMAICPRWEQFIAEVTCGDKALAEYLQTALGYSLGGDISAHQMWWFLGGNGSGVSTTNGSNGKSVCLGLIERMLGSYAGVLNCQALMTPKNGGATPTPDLFALRGKRYVCVSEPSRSQQLNTSILKSLVSGDTLSVRDLHKSTIAMRPKCKLYAAANFFPTIAEGDEGTYRRLRVIEFRAHFPDGKKDRQLPEKLWQERSGIFNWLLEGYRRAKAGGLESMPPKVAQATQHQRDEMNIIKKFVDEVLVFDDSEAVLTGAVQAGQVPALAMYQAYVGFCKANRYPCMSNRLFGQDITEYATRTKARGSNVFNGCRIWVDWFPKDLELASERKNRAIAERPD
jgi:P4 family phage/plasmid primase-like protien